MGVYGALLTGVTGLAGQSTKMGAISDNIANVNTVGYKKADVPFQSLVTDPFGRATTYSPGGVLSKPRQLISQQGVISGTSSSTDMAISGRGFFIVSEETDAGLDNSRFYTRAGSFRTAIDPDDPQKSLLQNTGGFYLTGIPVEDRNNLPQPNTLVGLETVDVNRITNTARATENVKTQANLAAEAAQRGAAATVYNADGTQKAFLSGLGTDPGTVNVTLGGGGEIRIFKSDNTNFTINASDYLVSQTTTATIPNPVGNFDTTDSVVFNGGGADLALTIDGLTFSIPQAVLNNRGFTSGGSAADLATALAGLRVTNAGTNQEYTLGATAADDDGIAITAETSQTPVDIAGFQGVTDPTLAVNQTVAGSITIDIDAEFIPAAVTTLTVPVADGQSVTDFVNDVNGSVITASGEDFRVSAAYDAATDQLTFSAVRVSTNTPADVTAVGGIADIGGGGAPTPLPATTSVLTGGTSGDQANVSAIGGIADIGPGGGFVSDTDTVPQTSASLSTVVNALNVYQDSARITAAAGAIVTSGAGGFNFTINDGTSSISVSAAALTAAGFTSGVSTVAEFADALSSVPAASILDGSGNTYRFQASVANDRLSIRVVDSSGTPQSVDAATIDANDFTIGGVAPVIAPDSNVDISASIDANGFVQISAVEDGQLVGIDLSNLDIDDAVANENDNTGATGVVAGSDGDWGDVFTSDLTQTQLIYDALGSPHNVELQYSKRLSESNLWEVSLTDGNVTDFVGEYDPTSADGNGARFAVRDSGGNVVETQRLFLKFNGDGSLSEIRTTEDGATGTAFGQRGGGSTTGVVVNRETDVNVDPKMISIVIGPADVGDFGEAVAEPIAPIPAGANVFTDVTNGAATTAQAVVYEWNVGRPTGLPGSAAGTGLDGLTQFDSGEETPTIETNFYSQDGARLGNISGVSVDQNGTLFALFDNGMVEPIYVLPVATFNNPDGLINYSGNIFAESGESGQVQVKRAGDQGAGDIIGSAVENSNVDLGDEFTNMIITQQSFTANTRVITTSDRMLEELVRILR